MNKVPSKGTPSPGPPVQPGTAGVKRSPVREQGGQGPKSHVFVPAPRWQPRPLVPVEAKLFLSLCISFSTDGGGRNNVFLLWCLFCFLVWKFQSFIVPSVK